MSSISFDNYTRLAGSSEATHTEVAGRYGFQKDAERQIVPDIMSKLAIRSSDSLLEIGCGPGNLLLPLAHMVASCAGIDNAQALQRLASRGSAAAGIELLSGDFFGLALGARRFSKVLIYSVLQYVESAELARRFLLKALALLAPGGRLVIGDLPNVDKKARFAASSRGRAMALEWQQQIATNAAHQLSEMPSDPRLLLVDDALLANMMLCARAAGYEAYVLPQPDGLPFFCTREDMLFIAPH